jgi:hypothetical protein
VVARGFLVLYLSASAAWMASLLASPLLGALLSISAAYGFWLLARGFDAWSARSRRESYAFVAAASRGAAVATAVLSLVTASLLASEPQADAWGVRMALYVLWSGLWIAYYTALVDSPEDFGVQPSRPSLPIMALGLSILLSPMLTEAFPAPPDVKLVLALAAYGGYMPPLNASALLVALVARR